MEELHNNYFDERDRRDFGILVFQFGRFATDVGLKSFQQDPITGENEHIVGLDAETFREQAEASGQPLALGAFSKVKFSPEDQTFKARVVYDRDFFTAQPTKENGTFEDILPVAVEFEFRKMSVLLSYLSHTPDKMADTFTGEDVYQQIYDAMRSSGDKLDKFIEYLGVKADAEHPDDYQYNIVPITMRGYIRSAYCELVVHTRSDLDEDEMNDFVNHISRNF